MSESIEAVVPPVALDADPTLGWPIVCVNLARDVERRRDMQREFDRLGLHAHCLGAALWRDLPAARRDAVYSPALNARSYHQPLVDGEKGCYDSHLRVWSALAASGHDAAVVLEDDVRLLPSFVPALRALRRRGLAGLGMVKLIGRASPERTAGRERLVDGGEGHGDGSGHGAVALIAYRRVPSLTAGYVVSRTAAARLAERRVPFGRPVDVDLRHTWETGVAVHGLEPAVIALSEHSDRSSIGQRPPARLPTRLRKFGWKARYSLLNAWHAARAGAR